MAKTATVSSNVVKVHVKFTVTTPDGLRRVAFDLEKDTDDDGTVTWKIAFQLFERDKKSEDFGDALVDLEVDVDKKLNAKAQAMSDKGMTKTQAALAVGPVGDMVQDPTVSNAKKAAAVQTILK